MITLGGTGSLSQDPIRILHFITTLSTGGAEEMLWKLLSRLESDAWPSRVVSLTDVGEVGRRIEQLGVPVAGLGMSRFGPTPASFMRAVDEVRHFSPDVVQTWMYHSDLIGGLAARFVGQIPVVWNIRGGLNAARSRRTTVWVRAFLARVSRNIPAAIVSCSRVERTHHVSLGYDARKMVVIPNGFEVDALGSDATQHRQVRNELGIPTGVAVVGLVARFDAQKDHQCFITAAGILSRRHVGVHFVLCGRDVTKSNATLMRWIDSAGIRSVTHLLGVRSDVARLYTAFDLSCSASAYGEGFPNAIGEAMACAVPCVVTDVGDSGYLVGDTGRVVPPSAPEALADACAEVLAYGKGLRQRLGKSARARICEHFDLMPVVRQYQTLYRRVAETGSR